jgi:hypothetical protein
MSEIVLPKEFERQLNLVNKKTDRDPGRTKVFIGLPSLSFMSAGLVVRLFAFAQNQSIEPHFHFIVERRQADYARNEIAVKFLESPCDYLMMIDHDVDPHPNAMDMISLDKDVMSGMVFCWINSELIPSIWERAECEQCHNLEVWMKEKKIHDVREYRVVVDELGSNSLERWNPFSNQFVPFADEKGIVPGVKCRCKGTGWDPFVFRASRKAFGAGTLHECDSVGSACMVIARRVMEKMTPPYFSFFYRPDRSIMLTEDHYFCWKAKELGFSIWADPQMICSHYKSVDLLGVNALANKAHELGKSQAQVVIPKED